MSESLLSIAVGRRSRRNSPATFAVLGAWSLGLALAGYSTGRDVREANAAVPPDDANTVYLYEELIEGDGYVNNWWAYRGRWERGTQSEITVVGEGLLAEFRGSLTLDAESETLMWNGAHNFGEPVDADEIERLVPKPAIAKLFDWAGSR